MKVLIVLCSLISVLLLLSAEGLAFNVSTNRIEINVASAATYEDAIIIGNTEKRDLEIKLHVEDWFKAVEGVGRELSFRSDWLEVSPLEFELLENEIKKVYYKVTVPKDAKGEFNAMIFITGMPKQAGESAVGINTSIGVPIYVIVKGTEQYSMEVESLKMVASAPLQLAVGIKNLSNVHVRPEGTIMIKTTEGKILFTIPLNEYRYPILPNSSRELEIRTEKTLEKGEYVADIKMEYADMTYEKKEQLRIP